jgi:hypothetical protein
MATLPQPDLRPDPAAGDWYVAAPYELTALGRRFTILAGFRTDLASVPRILWRFAPPAEPQTCLPALIHDCLYRSHWYPRAECDRIFLDLLKLNGENATKARILYWGVRSGGWWAYRAVSIATIVATCRLFTVSYPPDLDPNQPEPTT